MSDPDPWDGLTGVEKTALMVGGAAAARRCNNAHRLYLCLPAQTSPHAPNPKFSHEQVGYWRAQAARKFTDPRTGQPLFTDEPMQRVVERCLPSHAQQELQARGDAIGSTQQWMVRACVVWRGVWGMHRAVGSLAGALNTAAAASMQRRCRGVHGGVAAWGG